MNVEMKLDVQRDLVLHLSDYTERKKQQTNDKCDVGYELFKQ